MRMVLKQKLTLMNRLVAVALLLLVVLLPLLNIGQASASLLTERYIRMGSSADGTLTDGQDVTYRVGFKVGDDTQNIGGIVVDFCSNTPVIGDSCTAPTGFDVDAANLAITNITFITGFTVDAGNSTANKVVLNHATSINPGAAELIEFEFGTDGTGNDGIDNPENDNTTFFARIITYTTAAGADAYTSTVLGTSVDSGGIALSTAEKITVTAKVPEKLTFCVFTIDGTPADSCGTTTPVAGNAVTLGNNVGVLNDIEEFVNKDAKYTVATNALFNVAIRVKGGTLATSSNVACQTAPSNCGISAIGNAAVASAEGTEQFGFCTYESTATATLTPTAPYNGTCNTTVDNSGDPFNNTPDDAAVAGTTFAFDNNTTDGTRSSYGDVMASKVPGTFSTGIIAFLGNITTTTEPGIYTTALTFIATGTY